MSPSSGRNLLTFFGLPEEGEFSLGKVVFEKEKQDDG
jgi:hypothetical protein